MNALLKNSLVRRVMVLIPAVVLLGGCVASESRPHRAVYVEPPPPAGGYVIIEQAPPPPRHEVVIKTQRPTRAHVWVKGYWVWRDNRHVWREGHWELPPRPRAVWVEPRWERRPGGQVFIEGYWR